MKNLFKHDLTNNLIHINKWWVYQKSPSNTSQCKIFAEVVIYCKRIRNSLVYRNIFLKKKKKSMRKFFICKNQFIREIIFFLEISFLVNTKYIFFQNFLKNILEFQFFKEYKKTLFFFIKCATISVLRKYKKIVRDFYFMVKT